ncbi:MAG: hypothetical protein ACRC6U_00580, partial [Fusobacteriaceae bacterium]
LVCGENKINSAIDNKYNTFYIDLDVNVRTTLEETRSQIKQLTGIVPLASWYSMSYTEENKKQKHLFCFDVTLEGGSEQGADFKIFKNVVNNFVEKCKLDEIDPTAITPCRVTYAKKYGTNAIFAKSNENYTVGLEEFYIPETFDETKEKIINTGKLTVKLMEAVCKKNVEKTPGDHLYSYYNLRNLMWWLVHLKDFDETFKEEVFKPWIESLDKDSQEAIFMQIDRDIKKIPFESKTELKAMEPTDIVESIFEIVSKQISAAEFHEDLNIKRLVLEALDKNNLFAKAESTTIEKLVKKLNYVSELKSHKESKKDENEKPTTLTPTVITSRKKMVKFEGTPTFDKICGFEFQPGITVVSAPSHSGKTYLVLGLSILGKIPTLYYALDQSFDGFLEYAAKLTRILKTNETSHIAFQSKINGNGFESISNSIVELGSKVVIFDMMDQLPVQEGRTEYDTQITQIKMIRRLRDKFPNVCFILVAATSKGKKDDVTLESSIAGHRGFGYTVDGSFTISKDKEGVKITCVKDRYGISTGSRFERETEKLDKITDFFR